MDPTTARRNVPFNRPHMTGRELQYIAEARDNLMLSGDGPFSKSCEQWLVREIGCKNALLTHSGTAALEMAAILSGVGPGDEVIMPSYTFVSTANAFVLRGATPVFVDIRPDTLNIDEALIEPAVTSRTKALVVVHYAGVGAEMTHIKSIAAAHRLVVIEDAAHGVCASYRGQALGSFGSLGALSFHETKNITCGEGGALLINDEQFIERAAVIREKGTNRKAFVDGLVDKYTWVDIGSSFLPGEISAGFLRAQMEEAWNITEQRREYWDAYHEAFAVEEQRGRCKRPFVPPESRHNAHMYYLLLPSPAKRARLIELLAREGVDAIFHYVPLHDSPAGLRYGRTSGSMQVTDRVAETIVRLPMYVGLGPDQGLVIDAIHRALA